MGNQDQKLFGDIFEKDRWKDTLDRFIQVLRINIFLIDSNGVPIIHPCGTSKGEEYGCRILTRFLDLEAVNEGRGFLDKFSPYGDYLGYRTQMSLHIFAIPLQVYGRVVAHMIIGPVIMGKRLDDQQYIDLAQELNMSRDGVLDEIHGVKAISFVTVTAVLDLLAAVAEDFIEIALENRRLRKEKVQKDVFSQNVERAAAGMYKQIHADELLVSVLDVALNITGAEVGSIMVFDKESREFMIRVSRGLSDDWVKTARARMGQGVAGVAAQENRCFIMHGNQGDSSVSSFLNRPEIKESIVLPITHNNRVFGVINLHSKKDGSSIERNSGHLVGLSKLLSTAIFS